MDKLFEHLPDIIRAAAQSLLGTFALLVVVLAVLAYVFFAKAREKIRVGIFLLLFAGALAFAVAMFQEAGGAPIVAPSDKVSPDKPVATLSPYARRLLLGAAADSSGLILFERFGASVDLHSNGVSFLTSKADHQELVTWEAALQELVDAGLLVNRGGNGEIYELTKAGYDAAKVLPPP